MSRSTIFEPKTTVYLIQHLERFIYVRTPSDNRFTHTYQSIQWLYEHELAPMHHSHSHRNTPVFPDPLIRPFLFNLRQNLPIRRQPVHAAQFFFIQPFCRFMLQQLWLLPVNPALEALHGKMKLRIIVFHCA